MAINVTQKGLLEETAILIEAGQDKEDRLTQGSYLDLRKEEERRREQERQGRFEQDEQEDVFLPDFLN